jgi:hypothetical protein
MECDDFSHDYVHCIFCGTKIKCTSSVPFTEHLRTSCSIVRDSYRKEQVSNLIHNTFLRAKNLLNLSDHDNFESLTNGEHDKENLPPLSYLSPKKKKLDETDTCNSTFDQSDIHIFSNSDDEETITDRSFHQRSSQNNSYHPTEEEISPILSSCPFCNKSFRGGSDLSKHLLRCNARRRSNKKRTMHRSCTKQTVSAQRSKRASDNIQSLLLTDGGRHLPGYPKVGNNSLVVNAEPVKTP